MSTTLDQISEAIGHLRAGQEGTNATIVRLEQRIEGAIRVLQDNFEKNFRDIRDRHHEHNNRVMGLIGRVDKDMEKLQEKQNTAIASLDARVRLIEDALRLDKDIRRVHAKWVAFFVALASSIATGTIEFVIWLAGGHK